MVCESVGWLSETVCLNFPERREVTLPCSYRQTCFNMSCSSIFFWHYYNDIHNVKVINLAGPGFSGGKKWRGSINGITLNSIISFCYKMAPRPTRPRGIASRASIGASKCTCPPFKEEMTDRPSETDQPTNGRTWGLLGKLNTSNNLFFSAAPPPCFSSKRKQESLPLFLYRQS